jgi:hypothetical protein
MMMMGAVAAPVIQLTVMGMMVVVMVSVHLGRGEENKTRETKCATDLAL